MSESCEFIEVVVNRSSQLVKVEDESGRSISSSKWMPDGSGWRMRIPCPHSDGQVRISVEDARELTGDHGYNATKHLAAFDRLRAAIARSLAAQEQAVAGKEEK